MCKCLFVIVCEVILHPCCRQHEDKQDPAIDKGKARLSRFKTVIQGSRVAPAQHMPSKNTAAPTAAAALPTAPEAERKKITITPRVWVDGKVSDKPYGEAVKQIWNTASETPTAPKPAPKPAPTPTAPVSAPPPEAKLVADLKGNGVNTKTFIENMESLSQCLQRGEASARKTTWVSCHCICLLVCLLYL